MARKRRSMVAVDAAKKNLDELVLGLKNWELSSEMNRIEGKNPTLLKLLSWRADAKVLGKSLPRFSTSILGLRKIN
jgi:hypothetical protein